MDKIEFKDCKIEDLKVGDVYQQEGTLANQSREPLLRVEEPPRLAEKYGLPHLLLRVVAVNTAAQLLEKLRQELMDYAALNNHTSETVQILGVNFEVETLRRELSKRIQATQNQLANSVKQL